MLIDFEALYSDFVKKWSAENANKLKKGDPLDYVGEIYSQWLITPLKQTGGLTAAQYFENLSGEQAVNMLAKYYEKKIPVPSPLIDRLARKSEEKHIINLLAVSGGEGLVKLCVSLLEEMDSEAHIPLMAKIMLGGGSAELRTFAAEILASHAEKAKEILLRQITFTLDENDMYIADVLVYCKGEDKVYRLLEKLFLSGKNNPLYASYLGMYEDLRALPLLQKRIKDLSVGYVEFIELRNSIERLGGDTPAERDFSADSDYKALKTENKGEIYD